MMTYNITPEQQIFHNLDMQASMWANRIMTRKITKEECKFEVAKKIGGQNIYDVRDDRVIPEVQDMQARIARYVNAGLVTAATFKTPAQEQIDRIKQQAKAPPSAVQSIGGSKDGLWSTDIRGKR
jgi:hypothetical protein